MKMGGYTTGTFNMKQSSKWITKECGVWEWKTETHVRNATR